MGLMLYLLLEHLGIIIPTALISFLSVYFLTPNPRKYGKFLGWLFSETVEHIVMPIIFIFSVTLLRQVSLLFLFPVVLFMYGFVFGRARGLKEWFHVTFIYCSFIFVIFYPLIVMKIQWSLGIAGYWVHIIITAVCTFLYFKYRKLLR